MLAWVAAAHARAGSSTRYALVVGNNYGSTSTLELENLKHAEREARRLRDHLILYGNFDPDRVILVIGREREEILKAASKLARIHERDREQLGPLPTLFAFFFTGHGLEGKLLTSGEPLLGRDLASIFRGMGATLTLGFFDACFAGSLDLKELRAKGVVGTPGFNPVAELPEELLNSEGTLWFVSSRPNELSYEDDRLGGLFTHFFVEAFTQAPQSGVGITLDSMWEYSRRRTLAYVARYGRSQTPEKIVRNLKARGPLYFSYTQKRGARLVFESKVAGTFLLRYDYGALVEKIVKQPGKAREVAVYPGNLVLSRIDAESPGSHPSRHLKVAEGDEIRIRPMGSALGTHGPGYFESPIHSKGHLPGLELTRQAPATAFSAGAGYRFSLVRDRVLGAPHCATADAWLARGPLSATLQLAYGTDSRKYPSWSYRLRELDLRLFVGYGFDLGGPRLDIEAGAGLSFLDVKYSSGDSREPLGGFLGGGLRFVLPLPLHSPWVILQFQAALGTRLTQGISKSDREAYWSLDPSFHVGLAFPLAGT